MQSEKNILKKFLFGLILLGMLTPLIQHMTEFSNIKELRGAVHINKSATLSKSNWFSGKYQDSTEKYLNDNFGFRPSFVRLHNQVQYSMYGLANAQGVVIGKDWYLYEHNYIKAYYGTDFIGDSLIAERTRKLKYIQDILDAKGKKIIVVLAPGKGSFFPEFIPDSCHRKKSRTNYDAYLENFIKNGINYVDFKKWFLEMKPKSKFPLFGQGGIHWSKYGEFIAADSILETLEDMSGKKFPKLVADSFILQSYNDHGDYDIGEGMNLILRTPTYTMAYPEFHIENPERNKNKVLFVADSYYWGMFNLGFSSSMFNQGKFWYYNEQIYPDTYDSPLNVSDIDIVSEVEKNDVIVLLSTDANLYKFAFGFIDQLYNSYKNQEKNY